MSKHSATDTRIRRRLSEITKNQQHYEADEAADWLDAIRRQVCPICNAGPFTVVASHVTQVHGIDRRQLRDMIGVTYGESICDPDHSTVMSSYAREHFPNGPQGAPAPHRSLSIAGRQNLVNSIARVRQSLTAEQQRESITKAQATRQLATKDRDEAILELVADGTPYRTVAHQLGISEPTVRRVARRAGHDARAAQSGRQRGRRPDWLVRGTKTSAQRSHQQFQDRMDLLWQRLQSGEKITALADECGITVGQLAGKLRKAGHAVASLRGKRLRQAETPTPAKEPA